MINIKLKKNIRTCPRTRLGTCPGQLSDTNNNDNNIIYINLLNKYKKQIDKAEYFSEKVHIQKKLTKDVDYLNLTKDEQEKLYKSLM